MNGDKTSPFLTVEDGIESPTIFATREEAQAVVDEWARNFPMDLVRDVDLWPNYPKQMEVHLAVQPSVILKPVHAVTVTVPINPAKLQE
jgi:hypothetical protein